VKFARASLNYKSTENFVSRALEENFFLSEKRSWEKKERTKKEEEEKERKKERKCHPGHLNTYRLIKRTAGTVAHLI
jgi:hypothetical protein